MHQILLVDDEELVRMNFKDALEDAGFTVDETNNPYKALQMIAQPNNYKVLVSDNNMGVELTGSELVRRIGQTNPQIQSILVTGGKPDGWDEPKIPLMLKPLSGGQLVQAVREAMSRQLG